VLAEAERHNAFLRSGSASSTQGGVVRSKDVRLAMMSGLVAMMSGLGTVG